MFLLVISTLCSFRARRGPGILLFSEKVNFSLNYIFEAMQCSNPPRSGKAIVLMFLMETLYFSMNAKNVSLILLFVKRRILSFHKFRKHFFHWQPGHKAAVGLPSGKGGRPDTPRMGRPPGRNQRSCAFHFFCCAV